MDEDELECKDLNELAELGITGWRARALMEWRKVTRSKPSENYDAQWWAIELWGRRN